MIVIKTAIKTIATSGLLTAALLGASATTAAPIIHNGATFEVTGSNIAGATADFLYTVDFDTPGWMSQGGTDPMEYLIAVEFNLSGYKVASINSLSTDADGSWTAGAANSSNANGCNFKANGSVVCSADDNLNPFDEADTHQKTTGQVSFAFNVTFDKNIASDALSSAENHIGAFFRKCSGATGDRKCTPGLGLSQNVTFDDTPNPPQQVPAPGTLLLAGLGLLGFGFPRHKRSRA